MARWLLKTEPDDFSWSDLVRDKRANWTGVRNPQALQFMARIKKCDQALIYHTGKEKAVVGLAEVVRGAYPEPGEDNERFVLFDIQPARNLKHPVTLKTIKADKRFADFLLVRNSRLGVMPVPDPLWKAIIKMSEA
jgi:predicted RNA-binding protein with PUA-like domain